MTCISNHPVLRYLVQNVAKFKGKSVKKCKILRKADKPFTAALDTMKSYTLAYEISGPHSDIFAVEYPTAKIYNKCVIFHY